MANNFITGVGQERLLGARKPLFKGSSDDYAAREFSSPPTLEELTKTVQEVGCQQRGTEEICRACGALALDVPMCQQIKSGAEIPTE
jgi:hypothetical protein